MARLTLDCIKKKILNLFYLFRKNYLKLIRSLKTPPLPKNADGKVYINLGCGPNTSQEFINVDVLKLPHIHYINDIQNLNMFPDNYADMIYASHVLEHISRNKLIDVLKEWRRVLKRGGRLRLAVPDFDRLIEVYKLSNNDVMSIVSQLMGSSGEYDDHHTIWNYKFAKELLESIGFDDVSIWDPNKADLHNFYDKSSRTIKVGDRTILISLNIEAVKK